MQRRFQAYFNTNNGDGTLFLGVKDILKIEDSLNALEQLDQFISNRKNQHVAIALSYELKNEIEDLVSENDNDTHFPILIACVPETVYELRNGKFEHISGPFAEEAELNSYLTSNISSQNILFTARTDKTRYLEKVKSLQAHIQQGDIYEVNFCQEYYVRDIEINDPLSIYHTVNNITKAPYSCYFHLDEYYVASGSPERFIQRKGKRLISQPIKGTKRRGKSEDEDVDLKSSLKNDPKERSENVMIVDLVRNDLSKLATQNSVNVDELFGIYTFETVHQMISTISCELKPEFSFGDILKATFPMGSMTGAPKISAMKLIEQHENFRRGIFSGSIGYIKPNGDFDLNVIIRTLIYNSKEKYLSCPVGGAITIQSDPESEYLECITKVGRILNAFKHA